MHQTLKERRKQLHRGMPTSRLLTMVLMLAIMALIFVRLRDPSTWRWFARDNDDDNPVVAENEKAADAGRTSGLPAPQEGMTHQPKANSGKTPVVAPQPSAPAAAPAAPAAGKTPPKNDSSAPSSEWTPTGPTDLDPMEQEDIQQVILAIRDGDREMSKRDMPAYFQILNWVDHQSTALLRKRAKKDVLYSQFRETPDSMRLQIVELKLHVMQIVSYTEPPKDGITKPTTTDEGHPIYEVRGFTQEGRPNLYIGIVTDLPKGMPIGTSLNEDARLVGYFFKLQGYFSQQQQLDFERTGRRPVTFKAPLIIGRLVWNAPGLAAADEKPPFWLLATIGSVGVAVIVGWVLLAARRPRRSSLPAQVPRAGFDPETPHVDNWLDQAQSGRLSLEPLPEATAPGDGAALERFSGNILWENNESNNGHGSNHGNGTVGPEVRDNGNREP